MTINSNSRKLHLSSWLAEKQPSEFRVNLKLQKFLFFYEAFSKADEDEFDLDYLRAYPNGPVFSSVYGDYIYNHATFFPTVQSIPVESVTGINEERAKLSGFLVKILTEKELSDLTHEFDAWKKHEPAINRGERSISIMEDDFSGDDYALLNTLKEMYPQELIDNSTVVSMMDKNFLISTSDFGKLTEEQTKIFLDLTEQEIDNPVYVTLSEEGVLLID